MLEKTLDKNKIIEPKVLKGFRDFLPRQEMLRKGIISTLESVMAQYGFVPIDTPVLEYAEVLLGKGGGETDKQVYHFVDNGDRPVAMRFDLTVPFARYMAANRPKLYLPFKRFHFAKVWRGENAQRGRYREFMQCDFDMVGVDSVGADFEILLLMNKSFSALGISGVTFRLSHRGIFNQFLDVQGIREHSVEILRRVDKLGKIGAAETKVLLCELMSLEKAELVLDFISPRDSWEATLAHMELLSGGESAASLRLAEIRRMALELGIAERFVLDPSITRGLDYYTGIVYETFLNDLPSIGSVCSGGRYNNLAALYTKEDLPGVGASIGLDRLMAGLEELGLLEENPASADVLVLCQDETLLAHYHMLAEKLRFSGLRAEVYPLVKKLPQQFAFAETKGIPWALICSKAEYEAGTLNLKNLQKRESFDSIVFDAALKHIRGT